jgi:hypothetical protein
MKEYAKGQGYNAPYVVDNNSKLADALVLQEHLKLSFLIKQANWLPWCN